MKNNLKYSFIIVAQLFFGNLIAQTYNAVNAAIYADTWTCDIAYPSCDPTMHNPAYNYYSGNDCANYVSQCLIAGGLSLAEGTNGSGDGVDAWGAMPFCDYLHLNLVNYQNTTYSGHYTSGSYPSGFTQGDVVIFGNNSSDYWEHAAINVVTGTPALDAHTSHRYHRPLSWFYPNSFASADFYHIESSGTQNPICNNDFSCGPPAPMSLPINSSCVYSSCSTIGATPPSPDIPFNGRSSCTQPYQSGRYDDDVWFSITPSCTAPMTINVTPTSNISNFDICIGLYLLDGSCLSPTQVSCADQHSTGIAESINYTPPSGGNTYLIRVFSYGIGSSYSGNFDICVTQSCSSCTDLFENNNNCASSTLVFANPLGSGSSNYNLEANIGYQDDQDWYKVQLAACGTLTLSLSNLPYDYNLELYGAGCLGQWLDGSYNSGTSNEQIIYTNNTASLTTLYAKVYSSNPSNFTTASCYQLNFQWNSSSISQPGNISGNPSVCQGSTNTYSISPVSGATSYTWTLPPGWTGNSTSTSISATAGSSGGTISVTANNNCGSSSPSTFTVSVSPVPSQPGVISGNASVCQGSSNTYSISPVSGATSYTWSLPSGWSGNSTSTSISTTAGSSGGTISVTANNNCGSSSPRTFTVSVSQVPSQPGVISGNPTVCEGSSNTYSISPVSGASSYTWTLPSGWSGNSTSTSISTTAGSSGGTISVTANNNCGSSSPRTYTVSVSQVPSQPGVISGNASVCEGSSNTYSISSVSGATSYTWTLPSGWSGSSTSTSISTIAGSSGGTISVTANNDCGSSSPRTFTVGVSPVPPQPGVISGNATVCEGSSNTYSISSVSGATSYTWTLPSGWSGSSTSTSISTTAGSSGGTISVTANNDCGSSTPRTFTVGVSPVPPQPGVISGNATVCEGSSNTYSISSVSGATSYTWTLPSGWSGSSTSTSISTTAGSSGGTISVTANNDCGSSTPRTFTVGVSPVPPQPGVISGNATVCEGSSNTYSISSVSGATSYTWVLPSGWSGSSTSTSITTTAGISGGIISVTANNECGNSTPRTFTVSVSPVPSQPGVISGNASVCEGSSNTYSISPVTGASSYIWTLPSGWTGSSTSTSITATAGSSGGTISVTANNDCGSSTPRAFTVSVSQVPSQPGVISGNATVCQGSSNTYSISPVSGASSYTWSLPSGWSGSSNSTSITATAGSSGGTISVTANNDCGSSTPRTFTVSVSPVPSQPGVISGNASVCEGSSNTYSISPVTGASSYIWTLPSGWTGSSTSTSITATAGSSGGTISVTANNDCGSSTPRAFTVSVSQVPSQPGVISGNATVCQGSSNTYSISPVSGASSYTWSLPSGWSGSSNSTSITATAGSSGGTISVTANNDCGSSTPRTFTVSVSQVPSQPGVISGNASVCEGSSNTYSISSVSDATSYTWVLPSGWTGSSTSTSITTTAGSSVGMISVTANNDCGSSTPRTFTVSVSQVPLQPGVISGNATVCEGSSNTYSISPVSGATSYTWVLPSGWSGSSTSTSIIATAGSSGGTISVTANNECGNSTPRTFTVSVAPVPAQPGTISGNTIVCQGSSNTYSINPVSGATSYSWTLPSGWSGSSTSTSIIATAGSSGGTISVTANNSCGSSSPSTLSVNVSSPPQPGGITGNNTVCQSSSYTYSISPVTGATSYTWTLPLGWTGSSSSTSITTIAGSSGGIISVTANNSCGSSPPSTLSVSVASPSQPGNISGNTTVCQGSLNTYFISPVSGATSYTWILPSGWTGNSSSTSITTTAGSSGGIISVSANNDCGSSTPRNLSVSVSPVPPQPGIISGDPTICQGSTNTYSISPVSGATSYTWTLPSGWSGSSTSTFISTIAGSSGGTILVTANNECGNSSPRTFTVSVSPVPPQPGIISGDPTICQGSTNTYSISPVSGATSYTWNLPSGWSGSSTSTSVTTTAGGSGGIISVSANNGCGSSTPRTLSVSVSPMPTQPGIISGNPTICQGSTNTYSISPVSGATSYTWNLPSGWSGSSTSTSITTTAGGSGGIISVSANNGCGSSTPRTLFVSVSPVPPQPGIISGDPTICQGSLNTYSISPVSGASSYTWTLPSGWSGSSTSTSITTTAGSSGGTISVTANNSCGSSATRNLSVNVSPTPSQPGSIFGNSLVCQGSSYTYSISSVPGATSYTWTLPSGWSGSSTSTSISAIAGISGGTISVTANNNCGSSDESTLALEVSSPSPPGPISGNTLVCQGSSYTYTISSVPSATSYTWTLPSGWSGSSTSTSISVIAGSSGGTISVTANNNCGSSDASTLAVEVSSPSPPGPISGNTLVCQGSSYIYSISSVSGATSYTWTLPSGWSGSSTSTSISTIAGSFSGTISVTANNSCGSSEPATLQVSVITVDFFPGPISGNTDVCQGSSNTYFINPVSGATSYTWVLPSGWTGSSTATSIAATAGVTGGTISVVANSDCGSSAPTTLSVIVNSIPDVAIISGSDIACEGAVETFTASATNATSYEWSVPPGWTINSGQGTQSITLETGSTSGMVCVVPSNECGVGDQSCLTITIDDDNIPPAPTIIVDGPSELCPGESTTLSVDDLCLGCTVSWSTGETTSSITVTQTGGFWATVSNNCGTSGSSDEIQITQGTTPEDPIVIANGSTQLCDDESVELSVSNLCEGCSITWQNGATEPSINVSESGTFIAFMSNNCGTSGMSEIITVTKDYTPEPPIIEAIGSTDLCNGQSVELVITNLCEDCNIIWSNGLTESNITVAEAGTYTAIMTNICGTSDVSNIITVQDIIFVPEFQVNEMCFFAAPTGTYFQWNLAGEPIEGANGQFYTAEAPGYYTLTMTNLSGCTGTSEPVFTACDPVDLEDNFPYGEVQFYPNPVSHNIYLDFTLLEDLEFTINVCSIEGRIVEKNLQSIVNDDKVSTTFDVSNIPDGIYYFVVHSNDSKAFFVRKFEVMH